MKTPTIQLREAGIWSNMVRIRITPNAWNNYTSRTAYTRTEMIMYTKRTLIKRMSSNPLSTNTSCAYTTSRTMISTYPMHSRMQQWD